MIILISDRKFALYSSFKTIIMQKSKHISFMAIIAMSLFLFFFPASAKDGGSGININLRHVSSGAAQNPEAPRSLLIEAYYDSDLSSVCASLNGAGTLVDVYIENLDTEEEIHYQIPGSGNSIMPISGASGCWRITFVLSNGEEYVGEFYII